MIVDVIQFMRPDGRQVPHELEVKDECKPKYDELKGLGLRLTCEQLMNGSVSQTIEAPDFDFDIKVTDGSDLNKNKEALEGMIIRFDAAKFLEMSAEFKA